MIIVGQVSSKEEAAELTYTAKLFAIGLRARHLGGQSLENKK